VTSRLGNGKMITFLLAKYGLVNSVLLNSGIVHFLYSDVVLHGNSLHYIQGIFVPLSVQVGSRMRDANGTCNCWVHQSFLMERGSWC